MGSETYNFDRQCVNISDYKCFKLESNEIYFGNQYCNIYNSRLHALRIVLRQKATEKWGKKNILLISDVLKMKSDDELIVLIGTIYKYQESKMSILIDHSVELQSPLQPQQKNYFSNNNDIYLEDEKLRVKLIGNNIPKDEIITGIVCAVLGHVQDIGTFLVTDCCLPGMCPQSDVSLNLSIRRNKSYIFLLSGLDLINNCDNIHYQLLVEWLNGMIGNASVNKKVSSINLIIIAGNSIRGCPKLFSHNKYNEVKDKDFMNTLTETKKVTYKFDDLLCQFVNSCCVLLMPGEYDPTNYALPQQPLHPSTIPKSSKYKSLYLATNPWVGKIQSKLVAGSSGQPIREIMNTSNLTEYSPITWLEKTLMWRHFAPTAPNNLTTFPYVDKDPFIMQECPDIYFVGNTNNYESKLTRGENGQTVRLISIPKFSTTHIAVLVEWETLNTWPISFEIS